LYFDCNTNKCIIKQLLNSVSNIIKHSTLSFNSIWSSVQSKLPKNIFNFTIRYRNNTLPTRKNLQKWGISPTSECSLCLNPESLLHVVAGCKTYLNEGPHFTWRHDSVLNFIASILKGHWQPKFAMRNSVSSVV
jgi:hypothetical protein